MNDSSPTIDSICAKLQGLLANFNRTREDDVAHLGHSGPDADQDHQEETADETAPDPSTDLPAACRIGTTVSGTDVTLSDSVRPQGVLILGRTGTGKTTLLEHLIRKDIATRTACVVLDPQGPMTKRLLASVTPQQAEHVYMLEADLAHPFGINLYQIDETTGGKHLTSRELAMDKYVSLLISLFRKVFGVDRWVTIEYALRHTARTLLANPGTTMADVPRLLSDAVFRQHCLRNVHNPRTLEFWRLWEENLGRNQQLRLSLITKFDEFLDAEFVSRVVSQPTTTLPFRQLFQEGATVLISLPKGEHEGQTQILGALLLTEIARVIYERANEPQAPRVHLYIDEYPRFGAEFTRELLTGGRQFGCGTTVAFQHLTQLEDGQDQDAVLQMGTKAIFGVIDADGRTLARNLNRVVQVEKEVWEYQSDYRRDWKYLLEGRWREKVTEKTRYLVQTKAGVSETREEKEQEYYSTERILPEEAVFITEHYLRPLVARAIEHKEEGKSWLENPAGDALSGINELLGAAERSALRDKPLGSAYPSGIRTERERLLCSEIIPDIYMVELPDGESQLAQELAKSRIWTREKHYYDDPAVRHEFWERMERVIWMRGGSVYWADFTKRNAPIISYVLPWIARFDQLTDAQKRLNAHTSLPADWFGRQVWIWLRLAEVIEKSQKPQHTQRTVEYTEYPPMERSALAERLATQPPHHAVVHAPDREHAVEASILPPPRLPVSSQPAQLSVIAGIRARSQQRLCAIPQPSQSAKPRETPPGKSPVRRSRPVRDDATTEVD